ncbi:MAG: protein-export chaperone SecB [Spirochaetales bacterium]|jgi:hypothetical protein|nr:protein-export chaperone SecB [Spirochaetales bacterium]
MTITKYAKEAEIHSLSVPKLEYAFFDSKMNSKSKMFYSYTPVTDKITTLQKSREITVIFPMKFSAISKQDQADGSKKEELFFKLNVEYKVVFRCESKAKVSEKVKKEIANQLVPRVIHPYFRQTVSEALQKAGLPPLHIPLIESYEDDEVEL